MHSNQYKRLTDLANEDFVGGILVEYADGGGFGHEFRRAEISRIRVQDGFLHVDSSAQQSLWITNLKDENLYLIKEERRIFYVEFVYGPYRALAPKGVHI